jgi:hypothetical protein
LLESNKKSRPKILDVFIRIIKTWDKFDPEQWISVAAVLLPVNIYND